MKHEAELVEYGLELITEKIIQLILIGNPKNRGWCIMFYN